MPLNINILQRNNSLYLFTKDYVTTYIDKHKSTDNTYNKNTFNARTATSFSRLYGKVTLPSITTQISSILVKMIAEVDNTLTVNSTVDTDIAALPSSSIKTMLLNSRTNGIEYGLMLEI